MCFAFSPDADFDSYLHLVLSFSLGPVEVDAPPNALHSHYLRFRFRFLLLLPAGVPESWFWPTRGLLLSIQVVNRGRSTIRLSLLWQRPLTLLHAPCTRCLSLVLSASQLEKISSSRPPSDLRLTIKQNTHPPVITFQYLRSII